MNHTIYIMLIEYFCLLEDNIDKYEDELFEKTFGKDALDLIDEMEDTLVPGLPDDENEYTGIALLKLGAGIMALIEPAQELLELKQIEQSRKETAEFHAKYDSKYASWPKEKQEAWAKWQATNGKNFNRNK